MIDAFIAGVEGKVKVLVRSRQNYPGLDGSGRVEIVELPNLLYGKFPRNVRDARRLDALLASADSFSVVGADIMDGAYDWPSAVARANAARRAARLRIDARVLGFSWNSSPHPRARRAVLRAAAAGVRLLPRDPLSYERLRAEGAPTAVLAADIVFTADETAVPDEATQSFVKEQGGRPLSIFNASGLVARSSSQTAAYAEAVKQALSAGNSVVLLPHVIRASGDDLAACKAVYDALPEDSHSHVHLVEHLFEPAQVRWLVEHSSFVVTGRMHLSIIALKAGVPAAVVATQGKVEGLLKAFEVEDLIIRPNLIVSGALADAARSLREKNAFYRERVATNLPGMLTRAQLNFEGVVRRERHS